MISYLLFVIRYLLFVIGQPCRLGGGHETQHDFCRLGGGYEAQHQLVIGQPCRLGGGHETQHQLVIIVETFHGTSVH